MVDLDVFYSRMSALIATARSFLAVGQPGCERNRKYDLKTIGQVCSSYFSLGTERRTMAGWRSTRPTPRPLRARSLGSEQDEDGDLEESRQQLARMMGEEPLTGAELRRLVFEKFNRTYDVRLQRRGKRMYLHIMWKFLEQKSFPLTEEEYDMQLQAVAEYITMW